MTRCQLAIAQHKTFVILAIKKARGEGMKKTAVCLVLANTLILSACTTTENVKTTKLTLNTLNGKAVRVGSAWHINPDCTVLAVPDVKVLQPPAHGKLSIEKAATFPKSNSEIYRKCNSHKVMGRVTYYTPDKGFTGKDRMKLRVSYINGVFDDGVITVNVK